MKGVKLSESSWSIRPECSCLIMFWLGQDASGPTESREFATVSLRWPTATDQFSLNSWATKTDVRCPTASSYLANAARAFTQCTPTSFSDLGKD